MPSLAGTETPCTLAAPLQHLCSTSSTHSFNIPSHDSKLSNSAPALAGTETPYTLLTKVSARVGSASAVLVGADGTRILRGGLVSRGHSLLLELLAFTVFEPRAVSLVSFSCWLTLTGDWTRACGQWELD